MLRNIKYAVRRLSKSPYVLGVIAFGAGSIPAYRASRVDPMEALRAE